MRHHGDAQLAEQRHAVQRVRAQGGAQPGRRHECVECGLTATRLGREAADRHQEEAGRADVAAGRGADATPLGVRGAPQQGWGGRAAGSGGGGGAPGRVRAGPKASRPATQGQGVGRPARLLGGRRGRCDALERACRLGVALQPPRASRSPLERRPRGNELPRGGYELPRLRAGSQGPRRAVHRAERPRCAAPARRAPPQRAGVLDCARPPCFRGRATRGRTSGRRRTPGGQLLGAVRRRAAARAGQRLSGPAAHLPQPAAGYRPATEAAARCRRGAALARKAGQRAHGPCEPPERARARARARAHAHAHARARAHAHAPTLGRRG